MFRAKALFINHSCDPSAEADGNGYTNSGNYIETHFPLSLALISGSIYSY
ncbi:MAG TPA: hypothetical protein VEP89_14310 [Draconibacterium sp.]|nr:hypothetical protein [Draconibacterium sp.]